MRAVRRKTAEHLGAAWATIPHVTQCDLADITALDELRKKYAKQVESAGGNLTVTSIALKIAAAALSTTVQRAPDETVVEPGVMTGASKKVEGASAYRALLGDALDRHVGPGPTRTTWRGPPICGGSAFRGA